MARLTTKVLLSIVFFASQFSFAQQSPSPNIESSFLKDVIQQQDPSVMNNVQDQGLLSNIPDGRISGNISPACDPKILEANILKSVKNNKDYYTTVNAYFAKCAKTLSDKGTTGLSGLLKFAEYQYPFYSHPLVQKITIKLDNGFSIPAVLGLKRDPTPRPLVVVRCGTFCDSSESTSLMNYMIHLYDQSPFNVVILSSRTGLEYIEDNHFFSIGGWEEGMETLQAANWLKDNWEYKDRISSIHLMGISLGSNSAVMGSYYNDINLRPDGTKTFNSVAAVCPAINFKPTLDKLFGSFIVGTVFTKYAKSQFSANKPYLLDIPGMIDQMQNVGRADMPDFIGQSAVAALAKKGVSISKDQFFENSNFLDLKTAVKTPLMVFASKDDIIVNNEVNAQAFAAKYAKSTTAGVVNLDYGMHCAFSSAYGFPVASAVLRTFVLMNSPEFLPTYKVEKALWSYGTPSVSKTQVHVGQSWQFAAGSDKATVTFQLFDKSQCSSSDPFNADDSCLVNKSYDVPVASLSALGANVPKNDTEAQSLIRQFNAKVDFQTDSGPLNGSKATKFYMVWHNGF